MSSPEPEKGELLKAGHPPAVKMAGGVRIAQHKPPSDKRDRKTSTNSEPAEEGDEADGEATETPPPPKEQLVVAGAVCKGDSDFPPEAVKAFHEKPIPNHEYRQQPEKPRIIHQPR